MDVDNSRHINEYSKLEYNGVSTFFNLNTADHIRKMGATKSKRRKRAKNFAYIGKMKNSSKLLIHRVLGFAEKYLNYLKCCLNETY